MYITTYFGPADFSIYSVFSRLLMILSHLLMVFFHLLMVFSHLLSHLLMVFSRLLMVFSHLLSHLLMVFSRLLMVFSHLLSHLLMVFSHLLMVFSRFQLLDGNFAKEVSHEVDGLIFQPVPDVSIHTAQGINPLTAELVFDKNGLSGNIFKIFSPI